MSEVSISWETGWPTLWWVVFLLILASFLLHTCSFRANDERRGLLRAELPLFKGMETISR